MNRRRVHAVRVALVATALIAAVYAALSVTFDLVDGDHLVGQVDHRLADALGDAPRDAARVPGVEPGGFEGPNDSDVDGAPVDVWRIGPALTATALTTSAPRLPAGVRPVTGAFTATVAGAAFRMLARRTARGWLVAGVSLAGTRHIEGVLAEAEIVAGPVLLVATFFGAMIIGVRASEPIEQARRRQLEFAADASHELRTPLSVIEAEVDVALGATRDAEYYRAALDRIATEGRRLRSIVEDLLWLARSDAAPPPPGDEPVDVATVAARCAERFTALARSRGIDLQVPGGEGPPACINAPPDWIDQLTGVLVDNACRYAGDGGHVRITVTARSASVTLAVDDSGPGIPVSERHRLFDRFHRLGGVGEGAGLGLAIADAVVRSTGGRWHVGDSALGGARMTVSWRSYLRGSR